MDEGKSNTKLHCNFTLCIDITRSVIRMHLLGIYCVLSTVISQRQSKYSIGGDEAFITKKFSEIFKGNIEANVC